MIVRRHHDHLLLVTQPDHALLSADLMRHWVADGFPTHPRREVILLATREHDAGWAELDAAPTVDRVGKVFDFIQAPAPLRQSVWPRSIQRLADEPYAAALVAQHALHVYRDNRSDREWGAFFERIEGLRRAHLARTRLTLDDLASDYFFVRMGDLLSLFFANDWPGPRAEGAYVVRVTPGRVSVAPDPFGGLHLPFTLKARQIPSRPYTDDADLARALASAPVVTLSGTALGL
ncbi:MAG: DUF3891 family protein [Vicinamibacterales bacterium]